MNACEKGSNNLVDFLLDHGAKPDLEGTVSYLQHHRHTCGFALSTQAETALHVAAACDKEEIAKLLLTTKLINVNKRNKVHIDLDQLICYYMYLFT